MKILVDTNVVLDIFLDRQPFVEASSQVIEIAQQAQIGVYLSAASITDLYYIARKAKGRATALAFIRDLLQFVDIAPVDRVTIDRALNSTISDFEDAVQESAAVGQSIDAIVTRNADDFSSSQLSVYTPESFLNTTTS